MRMRYDADMLSFETCNAARLRRDPRYDGRFFTAVKTTEIYCRPVCPAKHPLTRNVAYYPTAAAAEAAGFRPCLRCRPETAPFCPAWNGTRSTVARAMKLINEGALDEDSVVTLATRLGIHRVISHGCSSATSAQRHSSLPGRFASSAPSACSTPASTP